MREHRVVRFQLSAINPRREMRAESKRKRERYEGTPFSQRLSSYTSCVLTHGAVVELIGGSRVCRDGERERVGDTAMLHLARDVGPGYEREESIVGG